MKKEEICEAICIDLEINLRSKFALAGKKRKKLPVPFSKERK
jgi:hypothetical protein